MVRLLFRAGRAAGFASYEEQVVPGFEAKSRTRRRGQEQVQRLEEAKLDVHLCMHPSAPDMFLDGSWRHACAQHALVRAAGMDGAAAIEGDNDKLRRYTAREAGLQVSPCTIELCGRTSPRFLTVLSVLHGLA
eukprot:1101962-Lingulodinium_polyedra.AAC.1